MVDIVEPLKNSSNRQASTLLKFLKMVANTTIFDYMICRIEGPGKVIFIML